jgi:hypothetical protein
MNRRHKVKFREDGERCPKNEKQLKNLPECGIIYDRDNLPFVPDNPPPHHPKFEPINRDFDIGNLKHPLVKPLNPKIPQQPSRSLITLEAMGATIPELDTTNPLYLNYGIKKYGIYEREFLKQDANAITKPIDYYNKFNVNFNADTPYEGQTDPLQINRILSNLDEAIELADLPAFVTSERLPRPSEIRREMTIERAKELGKETIANDEEIQATIIEKELEKLVRPTRPQITMKEMRSIMENLKNIIEPEIVENYIVENNYIDLDFEEEISKITNTKEQQLMRRLRAIRRGFTREQQSFERSNFQKSELDFAPQEEVEPYTPLSDRTDIRPVPRTKFKKQIDKRAGKLPEEARQMVKKTEKLIENIRGRTLDVKQDIQASISRRMGSSYAKIKSTDSGIELDDMNKFKGQRVEATEEGVISKSIPRELEPEFVDVPLDFDSTALKLPSKAIPKLRLGAKSEFVEAGIGSAGVAAGLATALGVSKLANDAGIHNVYATGMLAGASADVGAQVAMRGLQKAGLSAVETGGLTVSGLGKGALKGAVLAPVAIAGDMLLSSQLDKIIHKHSISHALSGGAVAGLITVLGSSGTASAEASVVAAPETGGLSLAGLIPAGLLIGTSALLGFITGQSEDEQNEQQQKLRERYEKVNFGRQQIIKYLPKANFDLDRAIRENQKYNYDLGIGLEDYNNWYEGVKTSFTKNPITPTTDNTNNDDKLNTLYAKYILHNMVINTCSSGRKCSDLKTKDPGTLTVEEYDYITSKSGNGWEQFAQTSIQLSLQQNKWRERNMVAAQDEIIQGWKINKKLLNQFDKDVIETAELDPTFKERYYNYIKNDALNIAVDSYYDNETKIEQLPKNIQTAANLNPDFNTIIHRMYNSIEQQAGQLDITVEQVIQLQGTPPEKQQEKYKEIQFDNLKENPNVLAKAKEISNVEDIVREEGYYDLDQALLTTDPTQIGVWKPSDAQIIQAHSAGMSLQQYAEYMHELSKGTAGDYQNIPKYSQEQIKSYGLLDWSHFQDELTMGGYDKDLWRYDPETLEIFHRGIDVPNTKRILTTRYSADNIKKERLQTEDMIYGIDKETQDQIDSYNTNLYAELSNHGKHFNKIIDNLKQAGQTDIPEHFNVDAIYNENKLNINDFQMLSNQERVGVTKEQALDNVGNNKTLDLPTNIEIPTTGTSM